MKRIYLFIIAFVFLLLTGCKKDIIAIDFQENGGTEVKNIDINCNSISDFALPESPTKEGFDFAGWYTDEELFNEFNGLENKAGKVTLYAKWEKSEPKIIISYEVNGGTVIRDSEIKISEISKFTLPETPVRDGYVFLGWFIDEELNEPFTSLKVEESKIVLYAKWGLNYLPNIIIDGHINTSFNTKTIFKIDEVENELITNVNIIGNELYPENFQSLDAFNNVSFDIKIDFNLNNSTNIKTINLKVKDGFIYYYENDLVKKINISQLVDGLNKYFESTISNNQSISTIINKVVNTVNKVLEEYEIDENIFLDFISLFKVLEPTLNKENNSLKYEITNDSLLLFIAGFEKYITDNIEDLIIVIRKTIEKLETNNVYLVDDKNNKYIIGENGFRDNEGVFHSFAEDVTFEKGYIDVHGYYKCYYVDNYVFDPNDGFKAFLCKYIIDNGNPSYFVFDLDGYYYLDNNGVSCFAKVNKDTKSDAFGSVIDNKYIIELDDELIVYDLTQERKLTTRELIKEDALGILSLVKEFIKTFNNSFRINDCYLTINTDDNKVDFSSIIDIVYNNKKIYLNNTINLIYSIEAKDVVIDDIKTIDYTGTLYNKIIAIINNK